MSEEGDSLLLTFLTCPFGLVDGNAVANNVIMRARLLCLCVRSGRRFTKDLARPDSKIWSVIEAELGYVASSRSGGGQLKCVLFATDGDRFVPVTHRLDPKNDYFSMYAQRGAVPWGRFGPADQAIVKALMEDKLAEIAG